MPRQSFRFAVVVRATAVAALFAVVVACASTPGPVAPALDTVVLTSRNPLGPSYLLLPLIGNDESFLGDVLTTPPSEGHDLRELTAPNPCKDKLEARVSTDAVNHYEDVSDLSASADGSVRLAALTLGAGFSNAELLSYRFDTTQQVVRNLTTAYVDCCRKLGSCGYGVVSMLVYGSGEYISARAESGDGTVDMPVAWQVRGEVRAQVLRRRSVHGYLAALVQKTPSCPPGEQSESGACLCERPRHLDAASQCVCPANEVGSGADCVCELPRKLQEDGRCEYPPCPDPQNHWRAADGACRCGDPLVFNETSRKCECPPGTEPEKDGGKGCRQLPCPEGMARFPPNYQCEYPWVAECRRQPVQWGCPGYQLQEFRETKWIKTAWMEEQCRLYPHEGCT